MSLFHFYLEQLPKTWTEKRHGCAWRELKRAHIFFLESDSAIFKEGLFSSSPVTCAFKESWNVIYDDHSITLDFFFTCLKPILRMCEKSLFNEKFYTRNQKSFSYEMSSSVTFPDPLNACNSASVFSVFSPSGSNSMTFCSAAADDYPKTIFEHQNEVSVNFEWQSDKRSLGKSLRSSLWLRGLY